MKTTILIACTGLIFTSQHTSAQLLDKVVGGGKGKKTESSAEQKTESKSSSNKGFKVKGEDLIDNNFTEDEYGLSGIYYYQTEFGTYISKFEFALSDVMSTDKGAEDIPEGIKYSYSIAFEERGMLKVKEDEDVTNYIRAYNLLTLKELFFYGYFQVAPGVLMRVPGNTVSSFEGSEAPVFKYTDEDWKYLAEYGTFFVKNKEDLAKWKNPDIEVIKTKVMMHINTAQDGYAHVNAKKNSKTEMPTIGKLNTKFIQDRALKTYNEKYNSINKDWIHHYMYVHGNEWVNKFKTNEFGQRVESHRELQVVIVRTSPKGECRADLMLYVEPFSNGKYDDQSGYVMGPTSYIGMPGGILPCEKSKAFESKLIK